MAIEGIARLEQTDGADRFTIAFGESNTCQQLVPTMLKSTTRHIHIFSAEVENNELVPSESVLTLDIDPDNELLWSDDAIQTVYRKFDDLVEESGGQDLTDYNLRRIGSDLEHLVRSLLLKGDLSYNLNCRTLNYSMGLPKVDEEKNKFQA
jgi:NAD(P)H-quinone oxidoreductase subunit M